MSDSDMPGTAAEGADSAPDESGDAAASAAGVTTASDERANRRKGRVGTVVSTKMDKTAVVTVIERVRHDRYFKTVQRTQRLYVHDDENALRVGDRVRVQETRPTSKLKRWRLVEILERAR